MDNFTQKDLEEALSVLASMISRSENAQKKFAQGTSQHTLQKNRIKALYVASSLIAKQLTESDAGDYFTKEDLAEARQPIASLISKSEKSREKLKQGTWQHRMLGDMLQALYIASPLLTEALSEMSTGKD